jgi:hypothetical protein
MREGILVQASNRGRYALDDPDDDLTSGQPCDIFLGGQWIAGRIEHAGAVYVTNEPGRTMAGYYFLADTGGDCGLAVGMKVRIP